MTLFSTIDGAIQRRARRPSLGPGHPGEGCRRAARAAAGELVSVDRKPAASSLRRGRAYGGAVSIARAARRQRAAPSNGGLRGAFEPAPPRLHFWRTRRSRYPRQHPWNHTTTTTTTAAGERAPVDRAEPQRADRGLRCRTGSKETVRGARTRNHKPAAAGAALALGAFEGLRSSCDCESHLRRRRREPGPARVKGAPRPSMPGAATDTDALPRQRALSARRPYLVPCFSQALLDRAPCGGRRRDWQRLAGRPQQTPRESFRGYAPTADPGVGRFDATRRPLSAPRGVADLGPLPLAVRRSGGFPEFSAPPGVISPDRPESGDSRPRVYSRERSLPSSQLFPKRRLSYPGGWYAELRRRRGGWRARRDPDDRRGFRYWRGGCGEETSESRTITAALAAW